MGGRSHHDKMHLEFIHPVVGFALFFPISKTFSQMNILKLLLTPRSTLQASLLFHCRCSVRKEFISLWRCLSTLQKSQAQEKKQKAIKMLILQH